jgi:hypothetical protein
MEWEETFRGLLKTIIRLALEVLVEMMQEENDMSNALQVDMLASGVVDASGAPLAGGKVYTYAAGTTTDKATYTDAAMLTEAANPVILGNDGVANVYAYGNYKFSIYSSADVLVRTLDNQYYMVPAYNQEIVTEITTNTTLSALNQVIKADTSSGNITVTLPTAVGNNGVHITVIKTSASNTLTIDGNASETINGAATQDLGDLYEVMDVVSDNANWVIVNSNASSAVTLTGTQVLTNKTLTTPVIASFYQDAGKTKLMTTPNTASDTLCAIAATQTLTNKTITAPVLSGTVTGTYTIGGTATITVEAWTDVSSFGANWAASTTVSYMKDPMGFVHLKGFVASNAAAGATIFTLGAGYRPAQAMYFLATYDSTVGWALLTINTNGTVVTTATAGTAPVAAIAGFDGITFKAA